MVAKRGATVPAAGSAPILAKHAKSDSPVGPQLNTIDHAPVSGTIPLKERLSVNSRYFDALIALIPAKFYLRRDDEGAAGTAGVGSEKYHKKSIDAPPVFKGASKKALKLQRFARDAAQTVPELQAASAVAAGVASASQSHKRRRRDSDGSSDDSASRPTDANVLADAAAARATQSLRKPVPGEASASLEDLRARLAARIELLRQSREGGGYVPPEARAAQSSLGGGAAQTPVLSRKQRAAALAKAAALAARAKAAAKVKAAKAAPAAAAPRTSGSTAAGAPSRETTKVPKAQPTKQQQQRPRGPAATTAATVTAPSMVDVDSIDFAFGAIAASEPAASAIATAPEVRGIGKAAKLKSMLKAARKQQLRAAAGTAGARTGELPSASDPTLLASFSSALSKAEGTRVRDDPKLLAASLKRLQKEKARSAAAWAARTEMVKAETSAAAAAKSDAIRNKKHRGKNELAAAKAADRAKNNGGGGTSSIGGQAVSGGVDKGHRDRESAGGGGAFARAGGFAKVGGGGSGGGASGAKRGRPGF